MGAVLVPRIRDSFYIVGDLDGNLQSSTQAGASGPKE